VNLIAVYLELNANWCIFLQAEIWSTFKGICRKSYRNLNACVEVGLVQRLLNILSAADDVTSGKITEEQIHLIHMYLKFNTIGFQHHSFLPMI